ncbi:Relaxin-3 receptor 2 [Manis javanica]|nr:Relaxin-3 receptor 2 [Manis javanica]
MGHLPLTALGGPGPSAWPTDLLGPAMPTPNTSALPPAFWANTSGGSVLSTDATAMPIKFLALRVMVALAYGLVGAVGLLGNLAVLWVLGNCTRRAPGPPSDTFVFNLALADLGLALTLPFWAAESALDFHWPFGGTLCKMVLTATVLNIYASIFLITALSVARYWVVAMAAGPDTGWAPTSCRGWCWPSWCPWASSAPATCCYWPSCGGGDGRTLRVSEWRWENTEVIVLTLTLTGCGTSNSRSVPRQFKRMETAYCCPRPSPATLMALLGTGYWLLWGHFCFMGPRGFCFSPDQHRSLDLSENAGGGCIPQSWVSLDVT